MKLQQIILIQLVLCLSCTQAKIDSNESSNADTGKYIISERESLEQVIYDTISISHEDISVERIEENEIQNLSKIKEINFGTSAIYSDNSLSLYKRKFEWNLNEVQIVYCIINPDFFDITIEGLNNGQGVSIATKIKESNIVIGSGFVRSFYPLIPTGLLKINSEMITDIATSNEAYSGIIIEKNGTLEFTDKNSPIEYEYNSGFQIGPIILRNGKIRIFESEVKKFLPYRRSFVGRNIEGEIIIGITLNRVHLYHLGKILSEEISQNWLEIKDVYNLSGGGSEGFDWGIDLITET